MPPPGRSPTRCGAAPHCTAAQAELLLMLPSPAARPGLGASQRELVGFLQLWAPSASSQAARARPPGPGRRPWHTRSFPPSEHLPKKERVLVPGGSPPRAAVSCLRLQVRNVAQKQAACPSVYACTHTRVHTHVHTHTSEYCIGELYSSNHASTMYNTPVSTRTAAQASLQCSPVSHRHLELLP